MVLCIHNQTISLIVVIISVIAYFSVKNNLNYPKEYNDDRGGSNKLLLIAITSAQDNFVQRQSIRNTWAKLINNENLKYYFLIGEIFCHIPPKYRLSTLSCEEWKPKLNPNASQETLFTTVTKQKFCRRDEYDLHKSLPMIGFSFILNHSITIKKFGINSAILMKCSAPIKLVLIDLISKKKIVSSTFLNISEVNEGEIVWKNIQKTTLPSYFEGKLELEANCNFQSDFKEIASTNNEDYDCNDDDNNNNNIKENNGCIFTLSDSTFVIQFLQVFVINNISSIYKDSICTNIGFSFSIKNINSLHKLISDKEREWLIWQNHVSERTFELKNEIDTYGDILLLDVIDVYRNLPLKMLQFYIWVNVNLNYKNYEYVLKTDDDVFIDVPKIIKELEIKYNDENEWNWWSCFRINWPVQKAGKWRELFFNQSFYPNFPSGAGYVLHNKLIKHINKNINNLLVNVQGEDVALGVWLNDLKPKMHIGSYCRWSCDSTCWKESCNIMELNVSMMYSLWQQYLMCNNSFCWCK